jgi:hypothetical protein
MCNILDLFLNGHEFESLRASKGLHGVNFRTREINGGTCKLT